MLKISPISNSSIKCSFSKRMYLALFQLLSILTNFLETDFLYSPQTVSLPPNVKVLIVQCGSFPFCFPVSVLTNLLVLGCSCTFVTLVNLILSQAFAALCSYNFDQLNVAFKATNTKLNNSYSAITCLSVFFHRAFCCPDQSPYYPMLQFLKVTTVWLI